MSPYEQPLASREPLKTPPLSSDINEPEKPEKPLERGKISFRLSRGRSAANSESNEKEKLRNPNRGEIRKDENERPRTAEADGKDMPYQLSMITESLSPLPDLSQLPKARNMGKASSHSDLRRGEHEDHLGFEESLHDSSALSPRSADFSTKFSSRHSDDSDETIATSAPSILPALQEKPFENDEELRPLDQEDLDPASFDLVAAPEPGRKTYSLETRSEQLFSTEHLKIIFNDPSHLLRFTAFLSSSRPKSVPVLIYYLDAVKAIKAINYSNAIAEALESLEGHDFSYDSANPTVNKLLEQKAEGAFAVLVKEDLPAYITHVYIQTVSLSISRRICGTMPPHLREASEGLAEVFCLTDPSRPGNPIVFSSEEFHRTTQYGMSHVLGRNCRFLQGPKTNPNSVRRIRDSIEAGKEHCEVFLNYRRDGSPFMNLLMTAPLRDSRGKIRYFIGAQVDVSGLVKEFADMESLEQLIKASDPTSPPPTSRQDSQHRDHHKDELQELSQMLSMQELDVIRRWGGRMHRQRHHNDDHHPNPDGSTPPPTPNWKQSRVLIHDGATESGFQNRLNGVGGKLSGIYEHYLLVRPYPSLRILFASPSLRVPGILQSPFLSRIGGSSRVREELTRALADGRGVTAKIKWISKSDAEGRNRWIHCTSLLGANGQVGVWMVVLVDDEKDGVAGWKRFARQAPQIQDQRYGGGERGSSARGRSLSRGRRRGTTSTNRSEDRGSLGGSSFRID